MDKFEKEQLDALGDYIDELQNCFIDGDAYSRVPSLIEWRTATRLVHRLKLAFCELKGYAAAMRQCNVISIRERLSLSGEGGENKKADEETSDLEQGFVTFNEKEIQQMPQSFRRLIIIQKKRCYMRKHPSGNSTTYEIRFRSDGYNISACGKTIELAKENFIRKMKKATARIKDENRIPTNFQDFTNYYFEKFRKPKIAPLTYRNDMSRLKVHILPALGKKDLAKITPSDCVALLEKLEAQGKGKTSDEVYSILSVIFKGAIAHGIIERNPISIVPHFQHERQHGTALTCDEEQELFQRTHGTPYAIYYALALYCGLRPNELKTAKIDGAFIVAVNSKRKNRKVEYKKIPICKRLSMYLDKIENDLSKLDARAEKTLSMRFPKFCPNHKLYDLRTTFYSRCVELGVAEAARDEFVGHSRGVLGNTYTDLSDDYLLKEGKKLNKW